MVGWSSSLVDFTLNPNLSVPNVLSWGLLITELNRQVLTTSGWNPPPGPRKMCGDLLYLHVVTLEDRHFYITACPRGFYLNQLVSQLSNNFMNSGTKFTSRLFKISELVRICNQLTNSVNVR